VARFSTIEVPHRQTIVTINLRLDRDPLAISALPCRLPCRDFAFFLEVGQEDRFRLGFISDNLSPLSLALILAALDRPAPT